MDGITVKELSSILNIRSEYIKKMLREKKVKQLVGNDTYEKIGSMEIVDDILERRRIMASSKSSTEKREFIPNDKYCTYEDIQEYLNTSRNYIYKHIKNIKFETSKKNKRYYLISEIENIVIPEILEAEYKNGPRKKNNESFSTMCKRKMQKKK